MNVPLDNLVARRKTRLLTGALLLAVMYNRLYTELFARGDKVKG